MNAVPAVLAGRQQEPSSFLTYFTVSLYHLQTFVGLLNFIWQIQWSRFNDKKIPWTKTIYVKES